VAGGRTVADARSRANDQIFHVRSRIEWLGLELAVEKTEAVLFQGRVRPNVDPMIKVGRQYVSMSRQMKYLGVILDPRLTFFRPF